MPKRRANGEGNIRKRKDGRWEGRYTAGYDPESGKRIIKNVLGKTQTEVVEAAYALHGLIDLYLRDQISAIATVAPGLWEVSTRRTSMAKSQSDNARMAYLAFDIRIQSRI